jgi:hypothetical protein
MRLTIGATFDMPAAEDGLRPQMLAYSLNIGESGNQE